jgi:hypothetical protein
MLEDIKYHHHHHLCRYGLFAISSNDPMIV